MPFLSRAILVASNQASWKGEVLWETGDCAAGPEVIRFAAHHIGASAFSGVVADPRRPHELAGPIRGGR